MPKEESGKCYEIILNYNCNARCLFCSQGSFDKSLNAPFEKIAENIYRAGKSGYGRIGFTGGEPLIRPDIVRIISLARKVGFRFVRVQTNGIMLEDASFCERIVKAGLTFCKFSFTSDKPEIHDKLVGRKGAWKKALKGLENLRKLKIRLGTNILVNRENYTGLGRIIRFFLGKGLSNFVIIYPLYIGSMKENARGLGVPLGKCEKYFREAVEIMENAGLPNEILFLNVPPCYLSGRESLSIGMDNFNTLVTDPDGLKTDLDVNSDKNKVKTEACRLCVLFQKCKGVDANYLEIFGENSLKPAAGVKKKPPKRKPLSEMFLSDNERCLLEILAKKSPATTREIIEMAKDIALCRDCSDGNAVLNAGESLLKKGKISRFFRNKAYYWKIK